MLTKMRKSIIIVALAVVICLSAATLCAHFLNDAYADVNTENYAATFEVSDANGWSQAITKAQSVFNQDNNAVKVTLNADWIASSGEGNPFGSGAGFDESGRIYIPRDANVTLDLNGRAIDRKLVAPRENGGVIFVEGELTVTDGNSALQGAYVINGAPVTGGVISGGNNKSGFGGAISVAGGGKLTLNGGTLLGNSASYGGAIGLYGGAEVNVFGGKIAANTATRGAGIASATSSDAVRLKNTTVVYNSAVSDGLSYGGGVYVPEGRLAIYGDVAVENNNANKGGGVYVGEKAYMHVSGNAVVNQNTSVNGGESNVYLSDGAKIEVGTLVDGASVGVCNASLKNVFTSDYALNNSKEGYTADPSKFFKIDNGGYVLLNKNGEVCPSEKELSWSIKYDGSDTYQTVHDYGVAFVYGSHKVVGVIVDGEEKQLNLSDVKRDAKNVIPEIITADIDGVEIALSILILPKSIDGMSVGGIQDMTFDPFYRPVVTVGSLKSGTDFAVKFGNENNHITNGATVTVEGIGNYSGTKTFKYAINPDTSKTYDVEWQYLDGAEWKTVPSNGKTFVYSGSDNADKVRAKLTISDYSSYTEYVYPQGAENDGKNVNNNMYLTVSGTFEGSPVTALINAAVYTLELAGNGNVSLPTAKTAEVEILPTALDISSSSFANEIDSDGNALWMLYSGNESLSYLVNKRDTVELADGAGLTYFADGKACQGGDEISKYARYTGETLKLLLNANYKINGESILTYLKSASVSYENGSVAGERNKKTDVVTKVTLTFNDNYTAEGSKEITFTKAWSIVTVNNVLRASDGSVISGLNFGEWTYGDNLEDYAIGKSFRPEHGSTVILTYVLRGTSEAVRRFAMVYTDDSANSAVKYYEVKSENGKYVADTDREINDANYFINYTGSLGRGVYELTAYVPEVKLGSSHTHWWSDTDTFAYDTYYEISDTYVFTVNAFSLAVGSDFSSSVTYSLTEDRVYYNGKADNTPKMEIRHVNGRVFVEGVDYVLTSSRTAVGYSDLTVKGIGSLIGEITLQNAYEIVKAVNGWTSVPSLIGWKYRGYDRSVNVISALPALLDSNDGLWFKIATDAEGTDVVAGLEHITLSDGLVSNTVAEVLYSLKVGSYYLFAYVDGNVNYTSLSQSGVPFVVSQADNSWKVAPGITTWMNGKFNQIDNVPYAESLFGNAVIIITDASGNVVFNSAENINKLANAPAGTYQMTATVEEDVHGNFAGISTVTPVTFEIYPTAGLPWWAVLALVVGALLVAALTLFILAKLGVFQVLTRKLTLAIRTKATVDATIAAVRANKVAAEAKRSIAIAKAREREEQRKAEYEAMMALPPEERAAALAAKAKEEEERAARVQAKVAEMQARAVSLREQAAKETASSKKSKKSTDD